MKGLLLKDFYMMGRYCRSYFLVTAVFIAVSFASESMFLVFYPCLLCGMIPANLLSYDERSRWLQYSAALPCTRGQIVSCKYLVGLVSQLAVVIIIGVSQAVKMNVSHTFETAEYVDFMLMALTLSFVTSSISLPFMFRFGVEKGRIGYYVMVGFACGGSVAAAGLFGVDPQKKLQLNGIMPFVSLIGVGIYILSWALSAAFYKKRELN